MPSIKNIDKFIQQLNSLGDEPRILQQRGQEIEPAVVPSKNPIEDNPFLATVEDEEDDGIEMPDLIGDLEAFDDDLTFDDPVDGAPDLEEDDDFNLDDIDIDNLDEIDIDNLDEALDSENLISTEESDPLLENNEDMDFDDLDDVDNLTESDDIFDLDDLDEPLESEELSETEDILDLDNLNETEQLLNNDEDYGLDALGDLDDLTESDDLSIFDNLDESTEIENLNQEETDDSFDLDSLIDMEDLNPDKADDSFDLDSLTDIDDVNPQEPDDSFDLDSLEEIDSLEEMEEQPEIEDFTDLDSVDDVLDLEDLSDEDLDTSDSLEDESEIKEIDIDDIGFDDLEEVDDIEDIGLDDIEEISSVDDDLSMGGGFNSLSIEDEVLEDDFGSLDDDEADEFSLGDFGDSFNFDKEATSSSLVLEEFAETKDDEEEEQQEKKYTQEEFESIKKTLFSLPLNLKVIIEEEIAENGLFGVKLEGLIELLIDNASLKDIVKYVNKKLGHNVKISNSFSKLTAIDFEKQKLKFSYILLNSVLPKLKWIFPISIFGAMLYLAGYFWIYQIIKSENIYKEGHELILIDKYEEAYDKFLEAFNVHRKTKWYYIYADTYYQRKSFDYAEKIYLQLINENSSDKYAILAYSQMKGFDEAEYEKATNFLIGYVDHGIRDYDLMVTLADLYMKWAKLDSNQYENARLWYAETMTEFGPKPNILFKYLNFFIETDKMQDVKNYRRMFEISTDIKVDGDIYARMAGYLMDNGIVDNVRETLFRGIKDNPRNPNLHYQLARYFNSIGNDGEVEKAARNAIFYYEYGGYLTNEELSSLVDTKRILGTLYSKEERYLLAENNFKDAVTLYENLRDRNFVEKAEKYGEIYSGYGDIFYYAGNSFLTAYHLYEKAEENYYNTPELSYKKGFINYQTDNMEAAIMEFHKAENIRITREAILFAKANTLFYRGSYSTALTYYNMHLRYLQKLEDEEDTLYPSENEFHLALLENYIRVYNNIGVTLYKLYGEKELPQVGMAFTKSTEYYDYLTRDPDLLIRSGLKDLAYYNTKAVIYPEKEMELLLYNTISKDFSDLNLGIVASVQQGE